MMSRREERERRVEMVGCVGVGNGIGSGSGERIKRSGIVRLRMRDGFGDFREEFEREEFLHCVCDCEFKIGRAHV